MTVSFFFTYIYLSISKESNFIISYKQNIRKALAPAVSVSYRILEIFCGFSVKYIPFKKQFSQPDLSRVEEVSNETKEFVMSFSVWQSFN